jgi:hypothetical protein
MAAAYQPSVPIFGHSLVKRLSAFVQSRREQCVPDFDLPCHVSFIGIGGLQVQNLWANIDRISLCSPDIVVLDIGCNDLSAVSCCPGELADAVYQFAEHLVSNLGVKYVQIAQIFRRLPSADRTCADFNAKVFTYNSALQSLCRHGHDRSNPAPISMFVFRGMSQAWQEYLNPLDGVHFTVLPQASVPHSGNYKYYRCIKNCIIFALGMPCITSIFPY